MKMAHTNAFRLCAAVCLLGLINFYRSVPSSTTNVYTRRAVVGINSRQWVRMIEVTTGPGLQLPQWLQLADGDRAHPR